MNNKLGNVRLLACGEQYLSWSTVPPIPPVHNPRSATRKVLNVVGFFWGRMIDIGWKCSFPCFYFWCFKASMYVESRIGFCPNCTASLICNEWRFALPTDQSYHRWAAWIKVSPRSNEYPGMDCCNSFGSLGILCISSSLAEVAKAILLSQMVFLTAEMQLLLYHCMYSRS